MTPVVVYVAGYGRSGSTLLDVLLGSQPGHLGAGELGRSLALLADHSTVCSCGRDVTTCPVWSRVQADLDRAGLEEDRGPFADVWRVALDALAGASGSGVVVDSSKTARDMRARPLALARAGIDVRIVHLVRGLVPVIRARKLGAGDPGADRDERAAGAARSTVGWLMANQAARRAAGRIKGPSAVVRFEDMVTDPAGTLERLQDGLRLDLGEAKRRVASREPLDPGHALWGNRMRWQHPILVEPRIANRQA